MKAFIHRLDEQAVRASHPIANRVQGWYFRLRETSAGVWRVEGTDLWGRQVSATGTDEDSLLEDAIAAAERIVKQVGRKS